jgi:hypothetical protein
MYIGCLKKKCKLLFAESSNLDEDAQPIVEFSDIPVNDSELLKQNFGFVLSGWDQFKVLLCRMLLQVWRDSVGCY